MVQPSPPSQRALSRVLRRAFTAAPLFEEIERLIELADRHPVHEGLELRNNKVYAFDLP